MRSILAAALLCSAATAAYAGTDAPPSGPALSVDAQAEGVKSFPASYFAAQQPNTGYDIIIRLPGFALDDGSSVRGFAGAAGNVLIDGQRPTSKTDDLISILKRIPAAQIERVDVIHGSAPGIDMQGKTVVANVILKKTSGFNGDMALVNIATSDGRDLPQARLEGSWRSDGRTLTGSLLIAKFFDDGEGSGPHVIYGPNGQIQDFSPMHNMAGGWQNVGVGSYETPLWGGTFKANLLLQDQPYFNDDVDHFQVAGREEEHDRQDQSDAELGLHFNRDLTSGLTLEALALQHLNKTGYSSLFDTTTDAEDFGETDLSTESIVRGILHWSASSTLTVEGGGEFAYNWLRTRTDFSDNGTPIAIPAANVIVQEKRGEAFTTATWRATPKFTVEAGLRLEDSTITSSGDVVLSKSLFYPKPRLLLTWSPDADNQVRVRVEREVGQLDFKNFTAAAALNANGVVAGNPNLMPQTDWAIEAAFDHHFMKSGRDFDHRASPDPAGRGRPRAGVQSHGRLRRAGQYRRRRRDRHHREFYLPAAALRHPRRRNPRHGELAILAGDRSDHRRKATDLGPKSHLRRPALQPGPAAVETEMGGRRQPRQPAALLPVRRDRQL